jgi:GWxTD domain-containing protein
MISGMKIFFLRIPAHTRTSLLLRSFFFAFVNPAVLLLFFFLVWADLWAQPKQQKEHALTDSLRAWQHRLSSDPRNPRILNRVALFLLELGKPDSALTWLQLSKKLNENDPETYYLMGRAYHQKGKFGIIPIEKLLALLKQDFQSKAIRNFEKAISLKPDYWEAYYYKGKAHLKKGGEVHFQAAVEAYRTILAADSSFWDAEFQLGVAYHQLKSYELALKTLEHYFNRHPEDGRPLIEMSRIYLETNKPREATHYFMEGVVRLRDPETLRDLFLEIQDIATPQEKKEYESLPLEKKGLFFKKFWKSRDPTPLTEVNERYIEHFRRVQFARSMFPSVLPPYYDDRGRIYVKYGQPDGRHVSTMSGMKVRDNESWSYEKSIARGLVFDFVESGGGFRLVQDLSQAAIAGVDYSERLYMAALLYEERANTLGGSYNRFSLGLKENDLVDFVNMKMAAQAEAPVEVFHYDYHADPLPFQVRMAQFRGDSGKTRVEIYHSVIARDLAFHPYMGNRYISSVVTTVAIFDTLYDEVKRKSKRVHVIARSRDQIQAISNLDQIDFQLAPQSLYHVVIQKENPEGNKLGIRKYLLAVRDFRGDSLEISDLEIAYQIGVVERKDQFVKGDLRILPYTFRQHNRRSPITVYYEIYNLKLDEKGKSKYRIDYKITSLTQKEGGLKKLFRTIGKLFGAGKIGSITASYDREGAQRDEQEYISFDLQKMPPGIVQIAVSVTDLLSGQKAESRTRIELIDAKER